MKKALAICILCLVLLSCAYAEVLTVGTDLPSGEIRDFYYTYDWIGYNAEYHRYLRSAAGRNGDGQERGSD